ncbi:MAG: hypothetical protein RPR97_02110, partial [Colwellia sp.]
YESLRLPETSIFKWSGYSIDNCQVSIENPETLSNAISLSCLVLWNYWHLSNLNMTVKLSTILDIVIN